MSPVRACNRHGRPRCGLCARDRREAQAARQRPGRGNRGAYRRMTADVLEAHGDVCPYCTRPVELEARGDAAPVLAHWPIAHADGGPWEVDNLRIAHSLCNLEAGR